LWAITQPIIRRDQEIMRIAVATDADRGLDSPVSMHFGHTACFVVVDVENTQIGAVRSEPNPFLDAHGCGQLAGVVANTGAQVLLAGGMGQGALQAFEPYRIEVATGASGTVRQAVEQYLGGRLRGVASCGGGHHHAGGCAH
jgi:predicted Fe-Mo cluster-binding NifX family protein